MHLQWLGLASESIKQGWRPSLLGWRQSLVTQKNIVFYLHSTSQAELSRRMPARSGCEMCAWPSVPLNPRHLLIVSKPGRATDLELKSSPHDLRITGFAQASPKMTKVFAQLVQNVQLTVA